MGGIKFQVGVKMKKSSIDLCVCKCPNCHNFFVEPSWFVLDLEQDFECGVCRKTFNTKKNIVDRFILKIDLDNKGKILKMKKQKYR